MPSQTSYVTPKQHHISQGSNLTPEPKVDIFVDRELGTGRFKVYHAYLPFEGTEYALKTFPKDKVAEQSYLREKKVISSLSHKNIIKHVSDIQLKGLEGFNSDFILLEYAPYGNFYEIVRNKALTDEKIIRTYFRQLIQGLEYLHSKGIAHVDLKLDNLLMGEDFVLKISDFDQSQGVHEKGVKGRGTTCYRAPEVLEGRCEDFFRSDIYSLGVILYTIKAREFPFVEYRDETGTRLVHSDLFNCNNQEFWRVKVADRKNCDFFSQEFKDLVNGMLTGDPRKRFTLEDIKRSRWYTQPVFSQEELKIKMEGLWERIMFKKSLKKPHSPANSSH